jgi:hypothetical protein
MASRFYRQGGNKHKDKLDIQRRIEWLVPRVYASIGLALYDKYKWNPDQIQDLFAESQSIWQASSYEGWDMLDNAEKIMDVEFKRFSETGNIIGE